MRVLCCLPCVYASCNHAKLREAIQIKLADTGLGEENACANSTGNHVTEADYNLYLLFTCDDPGRGAS